MQVPQGGIVVVVVAEHTKALQTRPAQHTTGPKHPCPSGAHGGGVAVVVVVDVLVLVVVDSGVHARSPVLCPLQTSLYALPPAKGLTRQPANCVQSRVSSPAFVIA